MFQIHYLNKISQQGTALWTEDFALTDDMETADGIVLRSANMHDMELPENLLAVARAGAGVNNIPLTTCADKGIVQGVSETVFAPKDNVTREQMATMLARFYALSGITAAGSADGYADADAISAWAVNGVALCTARGLIQGDPQGRFRPQSDLTRAQIAAILSRMAE